MPRRIAAILALDAAGYTARMAADREATLADLRRVLRDAVRPALAAEGGRVVKLTGDGALAEFPSAAGAILAAAAIQRELQGDPVRLRAGVHVGDVSVEDGDVFGDAVNIAARLEAAAPEGGVLVSRTAAEMAGGGLGLALRSVGALRLKGVPRPVEALALDLDGARREADPRRLAASQRIRFATSTDGVRLAWTAVGEGPTLVKAPNWITHLEEDWRSINAGWMGDLAARRRLLRFDQRGNGLSDRGAVEVTLERLADDLEVVLDAAEVARAPIVAQSQGCAIACAFAARRPERVAGLVLIGGFAQGVHVRSEPKHSELIASLDAMGRLGWDGEYPSIRDHFARMVSPDASREDLAETADYMRRSIAAEDFGPFRDAIGRLDAIDVLPRVACPALVLHATGDRLHPPEQGRRLAAGIPDARFVALDTRNHVMPVYDPAWPVARAEIDAFLDALDGDAA